jgi:hypothetical protein
MPTPGAVETASVRRLPLQVWIVNRSFRARLERVSYEKCVDRLKSSQSGVKPPLLKYSKQTEKYTSGPALPTTRWIRRRI